MIPVSFSLVVSRFVKVFSLFPQMSFLSVGSPSLWISRMSNDLFDNARIAWASGSSGVLAGDPAIERVESGARVGKVAGNGSARV